MECEHCYPIREHARANAPLTYDVALEFNKTHPEPVRYGACECRCHEVHRKWVGPA